MGICHVICTVDLFRSGAWGDGGPDGVFVDETRITGWFLSHGDLVSMEVAFESGGTAPFPIGGIAEASEDIFVHHGATFGEPARRCRFAGSWGMPPRGTAFGAAVLRVRMSDALFEQKLGPPAMEFVPRPFTDADVALVMEFENIGDSCEFGLVQRRVGHQRLGLLRYAGVMEPLGLAAGLRSRLAGFAEGDALRIETSFGEWVCRTRDPSLEIHTGRLVAAMPREAIEREERGKLQFLAGKLIEDLAAGHRIAVYRTTRGERGGREGTAGMREIHAAVRSLGATPLLWVNEANGDERPGAVVALGDGLYRGFLRSLSAYDNAHGGDDEGWLALLATARAMIRGGG